MRRVPGQTLLTPPICGSENTGHHGPRVNKATKQKGRGLSSAEESEAGGQLPRKDACLSLPTPAAPGWPSPSSPAQEDWRGGSGLDSKRLLRSRMNLEPRLNLVLLCPVATMDSPLSGDSSHLTLPGETRPLVPKEKTRQGPPWG